MRASNQTPVRAGQKQTRAFDGTKRVRVIDSVGRLLMVVAEPAVIAKYLAAPNATSIRKRNGQLCGIQLAPMGMTVATRESGMEVRW